MKNKKLNFIPVITILRGLAALLVCLNHFVVYTTGYISDSTIISIFHRGELGVQLFFVISGIVLPLSMINGNYKSKLWKSFLKKRLVRIEPPYLAAVFLGITYIFLRSYVPGSPSFDVGFRELGAHIAYLVPFIEDAEWINPVFWTLAIEFQYYLILMLIFPLAVSSQLSHRILFYGIMLLPILVINSYFFTWSSLFLLGILYVLKKSERISIFEFIILSSVSSLFAIYFLGFESVLVALITLFTVHLFSQYKQKYFTFLGQISYSLYLTHTFTGAALINVLSHHFTQSWQKLIVISLGLFFSIFCAYVFYLIFEKPFQRKATDLKYSIKPKKNLKVYTLRLLHNKF